MFWIILSIVFTLFIIYTYLNPKAPDGLKNVHSLTLFSMLKSAIANKLGHDILYLEYRDHFDNDGIVKFQIGRTWICLVSDPVIAKDLFSRPDVFKKLLFEELLPNSALSHHYGVNIIHSNGNIWRRHRRICNPAFKVLPVHLFAEIGLKLMDTMEKIDNKPIEVSNLMQRFTFDVLGKAVFGFDFNNLGDPNNVYVRTYNEVQDELKNMFNILLPLDRIPYFGNKIFRKVLKLEKLFDDLIENKHKSLASGKPNGDFLELMLKAYNDPNEQTLTFDELRNNLAIFMVAGHDTTANSLTSTLYLLSIHKNIQQKAREEVLKILGSNLIPSAEQHKSLKYINMIIHENLRLYPSVSILPFRKLAEDIKYKNHVIPAGTGIGLFLYALQRSPKVWENPEEFIPERFEDELHTNRDYSYLSFGAGSRMCLGTNFALTEQRIALCLILRKYELSLQSNSIHKDGLRYKDQNTIFPIEIIFKRRTE